jgi:hypothetical protein
VKRHASLEELARLAADDLKPRQAARIRHHLASCAECTELNAQLSAVPAILSSVHFGPMPDNLSARVETALAVEARQRLASEPATEAGRRELPARSGRLGRPRRGADGVGWRLPGLSVAATRALATAGAIALIGGGGYEIASHSGIGTTTTASSSSGQSNASVPGAAASQAVGAPVNYGHGAAARSIPTVTSATDFEPSTLVQQVIAAWDAAQMQNVHAGAPVNSPFAAAGSATNSSGLRGLANNHMLTGESLGSCVGQFAAPGRIMQLVENARYKGKPATIIVTSAPSGHGAEVWVVGESCSAGHMDLLDHVKVAHI